MASKELLTIKTAALKYNKSQVYIRRAIRQKDLETTLVPISKGAKTMQHMFTEEAWDAWRANRGGGSRRDDGRNKFSLYANKETEIAVIKAAILKALPDFDVEALLTVANPPKSK